MDCFWALLLGSKVKTAVFKRTLFNATEKLYEGMIVIVISKHWPLAIERRFTAEYSKFTLPSHSQMKPAAGEQQRQFRFEKCSSHLCLCVRNVKPLRI